MDFKKMLGKYGPLLDTDALFLFSSSQTKPNLLSIVIPVLFAVLVLTATVIAVFLQMKKQKNNGKCNQLYFFLGTEMQTRHTLQFQWTENINVKLKQMLTYIDYMSIHNIDPL